MAITEARHRANERYNAKAYDEIKIRVKKGEKENIQHAAKECGESVNAFINRAIGALMGGGFGYSPAPSSSNSVSRSISHAELFSEAETEKMTALLKDGQTVEDFIRSAVLDNIEKHSANNTATDAISVMRRLANMSREEQDIAMGIKRKK